MPKSRALKTELAQPAVKTKPKSRKEILRDMVTSGKEDIVYGQEMVERGKVKMASAKIMLRNKSPESE